MTKGVNRDYEHLWTYALDVWEKKIGHGIWEYTYHGTKSRHKKNPAKGYYKVGQESRFKWKLDIEQTAIKINSSMYNLVAKGTKTLLDKRVLPINQRTLI